MVAKIRSWRIILEGAVDLFCRQLPLVGPAVLVGQEAEKDGTCSRVVTSWSPP